MTQKAGAYPQWKYYPDQTLPRWARQLIDIVAAERATIDTRTRESAHLRDRDSNRTLRAIGKGLA